MIPFNYLPLLIVFGFLAVIDLLNSKKINLLFLLLGIFVLFFMNGFSINHGVLLWVGVISAIATFFIPHLGNGDKIVVSASFLIYPFYWILAILILAIIISKPILKIKGWLYYHFLHKQTVSVAFYPYLFLSTLFIVFLFLII